MSKVLVGHLLPRSAAIGAAMGLGLVTMIVPAHAQTRGIARTMLDFALIGFAADFAGNLLDQEDGVCLTEEEQPGIAEAAGPAAAGAILGAGAGAALGLALGTSAGETMLTTTIGSVLGRGLLLEAAGSAGQVTGSQLADYFSEDAIEESMQDYGENFSFHTCQILTAAAVVREPLMRAYLAVAHRECPFEPDALMSDTAVAEMIACTNNVSPSAREIVADIVDVNRAACRAIQQLGRAVLARESNRANAERDVAQAAGTADPDAPGPSVAGLGSGQLSDACAEGTLRDIWGVFVRSRMDVSASPN